MMDINKKERFWVIILTILCIACFPVNPLVITGLIKPAFFLPTYILGWIFWATGMLLVFAPIILFPRRGDVPKGKSFIYTSKLVNTGLYAIVRHPQYLGGILSIFIATPLLYPHWLFVILSVPGSLICYWSALEEEKQLVNQFGVQYQAYCQRVPRMNLVLGLIRLGRYNKKNTDS